LAADPRPGTTPLRPAGAGTAAGCAGTGPEGSGGRDGGADFARLRRRSAKAAAAFALVVTVDRLLLLLVLFEEDVGVGVGDLERDRRRN